MKKLISIFTVLMLVVVATAQAQISLSGIKKKNLKSEQYVRTNRNWSGVAADITKGCRTDREKTLAIYNWICDNIAYDTDYKIYHVDECWDARKGVCQAYSELYYCLAKEVGLQCYIIVGLAKTGNNDFGSHAWVTVKLDGKYTLLDPTWGAGSVDGKVFTRKKDHSMWFDVDPSWMFFSHFPDDTKWQLMQTAYNSAQFKKLPFCRPLSSIGVNGTVLLNAILTEKIKTLPTFYSIDSDRFKARSIPFSGNIKIGKAYNIKIHPESGVEWAVINEGTWYREWQKDEKGNIYMTVTPEKQGKLTLSVRRTSEEKSFYTVVEYKVKGGK
ncbi:MAG: transglutaminase domain-containing protein [Bacteroidales bacterium]|nr:transglutaminase domain-containing protein [Bacteroidales bacterium]